MSLFRYIDCSILRAIGFTYLNIKLICISAITNEGADVIDTSNKVNRRQWVSWRGILEVGEGGLKLEDIKQPRYLLDTLFFIIRYSLQACIDFRRFEENDGSCNRNQYVSIPAQLGCNHPSVVQRRLNWLWKQGKRMDLRSSP